MNDMKLGIGLDMRGGWNTDGAQWVPKDGTGRRPALVLDLENNRGWYDGRTYATEAAALAAVGGTASGGTRKIGDHVATDAPELLPNGDLSLGIGDWTALNGATAAIVAGELEMSGTGLTNPTVRSGAASTQQGKAYRAKATYRKGTATGSPLVISSRSATMSPLSNALAQNASLVPTTFTRTFGGEGAAHYLGLRTVSGPGGTICGDSFSIKEATAFAGFSSPAFAVIIKFRVPANLPASTRVLFSFDDDGARNRYRAALNADGTITVTLDSNGTNRTTHVIASNLVTPGAGHTLHISSDGSSRFLVAFDETHLYGQQAGFTPAGACWVRLGASPAAGEEWTGTILSAALFAQEYAPPGFIWAIGDSYVAGTGGSSLEQGIETSNASRLVVSSGAGGSTVVAQLATMRSNPGLYGCVLVHWDGDANGANAATDPATFESMASLAARHVFVGSVRRMNHSAAEIATTNARNSWLSSRFGLRYIDPHPTLQALATTSTEDLAALAAGRAPPTCLQADGTHLTVAAMNAVSAAVLARIEALGW
ncbi:hypothetical protein C0075_02275 [Rhizobium sp. KAs_5_22]|uniref:hypothetical protein n=1 Tax=Ciceribacter selenitireducens TaxID=448181 RepID=UPI00048CEBDD|nr:hypothetical protein [Ciceribacter selenitireducens]PPJ49409.1 hypothetical protein C0075_02275 [Rhizobium sp. KAs_5_22]